MSEPTTGVLPDHLANHALWVKEIKDARVGDRAADENDDLSPSVVFRREDVPIALVIARQVNRDEGLAAVARGVPGFSADEIHLTLDTHMTDRRFYEKYGRTPDPHELQRLCDVEGACELGLITDAMTILRATRAGELEQLCLPYHVHKTARTVHWIDDQVSHIVSGEDGDGWRLGGIVPDAMREAFLLEPGEKLAEQSGLSFADFGLTAEQARLEMDISMARLFSLLGYLVAFLIESDEAQHRLQEVLALDRTHKVLDPEGNVISAPANDGGPLSPLAVFAALIRERDEALRDAVHQDELAESERRRKEREAGSDREHIDPFDKAVINANLTDFPEPRNRAERRAAARRR